MSCLSCGRMLHDECVDTVNSICCCRRESVHESSPTGNGNSGDSGMPKASRGRPLKNAADIEDPHSTWRRRASVEFPLDKEQPCEWLGLKNVGGGKYPIVGCVAGKQSSIHHGPVKITIGFTDEDGTPFDFNREGNLHKVCGRCHNLWHHWNDAPYDASEWSKYPNSPEEASTHELAQWANPRTRPTPPFPRTVPRKVDEN